MREEKLYDQFNTVLEYWKKKGYQGKDVSDILATPIYSRLSILSATKKWGKFIYYPFYVALNKYPDRIRSTFNLNTNNKYAQAHAAIVRGLIAVYKVKPNDEIKREIYRLSEEILELRNKRYSTLCWGQPYNWPSKHIMKKNTPRTTVTSQVAHAFIDIYEAFGDKEYLNKAKSCCEFFLEHLNYKEDKDGDLCFSYTTQDNYHVFNPSMMAAAVLKKVYFHTSISKYNTYAMKAARYTAKHQNPDGSWYYRGKPDTIAKMIDNYHTGFVLESFQDIKNYSCNNFQFDQELKKGLAFYADNFFENDTVPKYRPNKVYPIDIQGCGQSIITLVMCSNSQFNYDKLIENIVNFTNDNFYDNRGYFYYRIYDGNRIDKNAYIRWGDSWMLRALGMLIEKEAK